MKANAVFASRTTVSSATPLTIKTALSVRMVSQPQMESAFRTMIRSKQLKNKQMMKTRHLKKIMRRIVISRIVSNAKSIIQRGALSAKKALGKGMYVVIRFD